MYKNQALNTSVSLVDAHISENAKVYVQIVEKDDVIAVVEDSKPEVIEIIAPER